MRKKRNEMALNSPRWFTAAEVVEVRDRWQREESTKEIGRSGARNLEQGGGTIFGQPAVYRGIGSRSRWGFFPGQPMRPPKMPGSILRGLRPHGEF